MAEALSGCLHFFFMQMHVAQAALHLLNRTQQQRTANVKGLPPQAVLCTLDFGGTLLYLRGSCYIACHHAPHEAGELTGHSCLCYIRFLGI